VFQKFGFTAAHVLREILESIAGDK
jgi:hypothetical protein